MVRPWYSCARPKQLSDFSFCLPTIAFCFGSTRGVIIIILITNYGYLKGVTILHLLYMKSTSFRYVFTACFWGELCSVT